MAKAVSAQPICRQYVVFAEGVQGRSVRPDDVSAAQFAICLEQTSQTLVEDLGGCVAEGGSAQCHRCCCLYPVCKWGVASTFRTDSFTVAEVIVVHFLQCTLSPCISYFGVEP